jgi:hypothetical protein
VQVGPGGKDEFELIGEVQKGDFVISNEMEFGKKYCSFIQIYRQETSMI